MSNLSAKTDVKVVDDVAALFSLLDHLIGLPADPPSLYFDLEGVKLGRLGSLSILSIYVAPTRKVYLVDVHILSSAAFSTTNSNGDSLKAILESSTIPKVFFDIRNDSDALFSLYQVSVDCIKDLQLMELATRKTSMRYVSGLAKCIERDSTASNAVKLEWQRTKESAGRLYDPAKGGRYEVFNERPMRPEIVQYCARDVALLPNLWMVYNAKLAPPGEAFWRVQIRTATKERVKFSQSLGYDGQAESKVHGPWSQYQIEMNLEGWNDMVLSGDFVLDENDNWVDECHVPTFSCFEARMIIGLMYLKCK